MLFGVVVIDVLQLMDIGSAAYAALFFYFIGGVWGGQVLGGWVWVLHSLTVVAVSLTKGITIHWYSMC